MRKIITSLLAPIFIAAPALTAVACGTNETISNQDILNSAVGRMQDHTFDMTTISVSKLPKTNDLYGSLSSVTRNDITKYYSDLVTSGGLTWDYPTVNVNITADAHNDTFINKYGPNVEARINLTAHLSYKNLTADTDLTVKINNDLTNNETKIDDIATYLDDYLTAKKPVFDFKTLFADGLKSSDSSSRSSVAIMEASLKNALFKETTPEQPIPIIDVAGIDLSIEPKDSSSVIYNLDSSAVHSSGIITGQLENLKVTLMYTNPGGFAQKEIATSTFKISQTFSSANNQLSNILSQGPDALQFGKSDLVDGKLPDASTPTVLSKYDPNKEFRNKVAQKLFDFIKVVYPTEKMKGTEAWDATRISFPNENSAAYVSNNEHSGYFLVNVAFDFNVAAGQSINATASDLKLNLNDY